MAIRVAMKKKHTQQTRYGSRRSLFDWSIFSYYAHGTLSGLVAVGSGVLIYWLIGEIW